MSTGKTPTTVKVIQDGIENHVVGMTEEQAVRTLILNGVKPDDIRVWEPDSVYTMGYCSDRINLHIEHGKVVKATRG